MMLGPNLHQGNGKSFSTRFAFFFFFNSHLEFLSRKKVRSSEKKSVFRTPARLLLLFAAAAAENADDNDERWRKVLHCIIAAAESELFFCFLVRKFPHVSRSQFSATRKFSLMSLGVCWMLSAVSFLCNRVSPYSEHCPGLLRSDKIVKNFWVWSFDEILII